MDWEKSNGEKEIQKDLNKVTNNYCDIINLIKIENSQKLIFYWILWRYLQLFDNFKKLYCKWIKIFK